MVVSVAVSVAAVAVADFEAITQFQGGAKDRWAERASLGMTDAELEAALQAELGAGQGYTDAETMHSVRSAGRGLKVWAGGSETPVLEGADTVRMAREVYGIKLPAVA